MCSSEEVRKGRGAPAAPRSLSGASPGPGAAGVDPPPSRSPPQRLHFPALPSAERAAGSSLAAFPSLPSLPSAGGSAGRSSAAPVPPPPPSAVPSRPGAGAAAGDTRRRGAAPCGPPPACSPWRSAPCPPPQVSRGDPGGWRAGGREVGGCRARNPDRCCLSLLSRLRAGGCGAAAGREPLRRAPEHQAPAAARRRGRRRGAEAGAEYAGAERRGAEPGRSQPPGC